MKAIRRKTFWIALFLVGAALSARGQLEFRCQLKHERVLQYETVRAVLQIQNRTAGEWVLEPAQIGFDVERSPGALLQPRGTLVKKAVRLAPHERRTLELDLLAAYDLRATGPYTVSPWLEYDGERHYASRRYLDVLPGFELARMISAHPGRGGPPRIFRLISLNRERSDHLFLRIEDARGGLCYAVIDMGQTIRLRPPSLEIDGQGKIHVLFQHAPARYVHDVFSFDGNLLEQQLYSSLGGQAVTLQTDDRGRIRVSGKRIPMPAQ